MKVITQSAEVILLYRSIEMITLISTTLVGYYQRKCLCYVMTIDIVFMN